MKMLYISNRIFKKLVLTSILVCLGILYSKGLGGKLLNVFHNMHSEFLKIIR